LLRLLRAVALAYLFVLLAMLAFQDRLIYFPTREEEPALVDLAQRLGLEPWREAGGGIIGWKTARPKGLPPAANRLVVFHGNAGCAVVRSYFSEGFDALDGGALWQVYLFEYPGFGARPGTPGKKTIAAAAEAAWRQLQAEDSRPVYVLGESIGSGPACWSTRFSPPPRGLCLVTPFRSIREVAAFHYPWLPTRWLLRDQWDNAAALAGFRGPVAVTLAGEDEVIPSAQGRALYDGFAGPKRLWEVPGVGHNDLDDFRDSPRWRELSDFLLKGAQ
jgi:hypothetical protein